MYREHPNDDVTEIYFCNVDFLEDEFLIIGEINKDVELFELQQDIQQSFGEKEDLNSNQVTEDGMPPYPKGTGETCLLRRMIFINLQYMRRVNL